MAEGGVAQLSQGIDPSPCHRTIVGTSLRCIHFQLTDPKTFLKGPLAPKNRGFEGERVPKNCAFLIKTSTSFLASFFRISPNEVWKILLEKSFIRA